MQIFSAVNAVAGSMTGMANLTGASGLLQSAGAEPGLDSGLGEGGVQTPFAGLLKKAVTNVQGLENQAANEVQGLMTVKGVDIHDAMIATEKADMSFEMALAVRGKAVAAYQAMMQMQF